MLRLFAATAVALLALLLGGCTMDAPSRLGEYQLEAEGLSDDVVAMIPADLMTGDVETDSRARFGDTTSSAQRPGDPAWWEVRTFVTLVDQADASTGAAAAIAAGLTADGWDESRVREIDDGTRITDGFRKELDGGDWYIEVTWVVTQPGSAETVMITVVSPQTTRGDSTDAG